MFRLGVEPFEVGRDSVSPVNADDKAKGEFPFSGTIEKVTFEVTPKLRREKNGTSSAHAQKGVHMQSEITLVDRGRGLQLSTSRITVHDLVPYFHDGCSHDEIIRWLPSLTHDEVQIVECYYRQHKDELDEYESRVRAFRTEQVRLQRLRDSEREGSRHERLAELRQRLRQRRQEADGEEARG
jgi:Protein of unknown function (DUF433)